MRCKIFRDGVLINIIESEPEFCTEFCKENGYTYVLEKPEPIPDPEDTEAVVMETMIDHELRLSALELGV